jgi:ribonuclease T
MARRFRGFLPVVVDVETGGFECRTDALLQIAAVLIDINAEGHLRRGETHSFHVRPFENSRLDPASLQVNKIDPWHPLRPAIDESDALQRVFRAIRAAIRTYGCRRAVLVGHNASFDLAFLNAAVTRTGMKRNPFHPFSCFDTATLAGAALGQTVLAKAVSVAGMAWDQASAHSATYDAERTGFRLGGAVARAAGARRRVVDLKGSTKQVGSGRRGGYHARGLQDLSQLTVAVHLEHDVAAAHEFAVDVELRVSRPAREALKCLAQLGIFEDIDVMELGAQMAQRGGGLSRKTALRKFRGALHEQHHRRGAEFFANTIVDVHFKPAPETIALR